MAVGVVILGTLAIISVIMAWFALAPVINKLGAPEDFDELWTEAGTQAISARDQTFKSLLVLPIVLIGAIAAWMVLSVVRRDYAEF